MTLRRVSCHCSVEGPDAAKKAAAYDVEVEVDDPKKSQMSAFMMSSQNQQVSSRPRNPKPRATSFRYR